MTKVVNRHQLPQGLGIIANMFKGTNPADNALFLQRALKAKGHQLDNTGTQRELDANLGMAGLESYGGQSAKNMGLDPSKMSSNELLLFAAQLAHSKKKNDLALSHRTTSGGISDQAAAAQKLTNDNALAEILLQNEGLAGDKIVQETLNLEDEATNASALNDANILKTGAGTNKINQETQNLINAAGIDTRKGAADVDQTEAKTTQTQVETYDDSNLTQAKTAGVYSDIENEAKLTDANVDLLKSKVTVQNATRWLQVSKAAAARSGTRNKNAESAARVLEIEASTGLLGEKAKQIIADIANEKYESALRGMKTATEAMVTTLVGGAKVDKFKQEMEVLKQEILNLQSTADNHKNESTARVRHTDGKTDLTAEETTQVQVETASGAKEVESRINLNAQKGETELQRALLGESKDQGQRIQNYNLLNAGAKEPGKIKPGTGTSKTGSGKTSQQDFRKTSVFQRLGRDLEAEGVGYNVPKKYFDETAYLWPDQDEGLRAILSPHINSNNDSALRNAMAEAKVKLSQYGIDDPDAVKAIIQKILQVAK